MRSSTRIVPPFIFNTKNNTFFPGGLLPPLKKIEEHVVPAGGESSVTFSSIASTVGTHLVVQVYAAGDGATTEVNARIRFNGDSGSNYNVEHIDGVNATASSSIGTGINEGRTVGAPGTDYTNGFGGGFVLLPHAFNTTKHKNALALGGGAENGVTARLTRWANTAALTSINLFPHTGNFIAGSIFTLWAVDDTYLIDSSILSGADGTFSFTNIPQQYSALCVIGDWRSARADANDGIQIQFNGDTTATNYHNQYLIGSNATPTAATQNNDQFTGSTADNAAANVFSPALGLITAYAEGDNDPAYVTVYGQHDGAGTPAANVMLLSGRRNNVAAVTSILIESMNGASGNCKDGSGCWLYGIPKPRSRRVGRVALSANQASVTFNNIPQNGKKLTLVAYARTDSSGTNDAILVSFNGDTTAENYDTQVLYGNSTSVVAARDAADRKWMSATGNTEGANEFGASTLTINNYASTVGHKHGSAVRGISDTFILINSNRWENLAGIRSIALTPNSGSNFLAGSIFELHIED